MTSRLALRTLALGGIGLSIALGLVLSCRSAQPRVELEATLQTTITDPAQRAALEALIERRHRAQDEFVARRTELLAEIQALNSNYDASPADYEEAIAAVDDSWSEYRDEVLDAALEMRKLTSEEEWRAIAQADLASILAHIGKEE